MWTTNLALLVLRLGGGIPLAMLHGIKAVPPSAQMLKWVTDQGWPYPEVWAWAAALSEFLGAILVILGLGTRFAAAFIAFTMTVAVVLGHANQGLDQREGALMYLTISLALVLLGGGDWGLERFITIGKKRK
jgi:putative oxidoreductase